MHGDPQQVGKMPGDAGGTGDRQSLDLVKQSSSHSSDQSPMVAVIEETLYDPDSEGKTSGLKVFS